MIFVNKLGGGERYLIETDSGDLKVTAEEYDQLAEELSHRLEGHITFNPWGGLDFMTKGGHLVHLAYADEAPDLLRTLLHEAEKNEVPL